MPRGRRPSPMPTVHWHTKIPADLAFAVSHRLMDPVTLRVDQGKRFLLLQALLYNWVEEQKRLELAARQVRVDTSRNQG